MDSGSIDDELNWSGRCKWNENSKVYIRRNRRKAQNVSNHNETAADEDPTISKLHSACSMQERVEDLATEKAVSSDGRLREQSPCHDQSIKSADGGDDSTLQQQQQRQPYLENGTEQVDDYPTEDQVREANGGPTVELGSFDNLPSPESNDGNDMAKSSPLIANESLQTSEDRPGSERVSSLLSGDNVLSNGGVPREPKWPIGNERKNNEEVVPTPLEAQASDGLSNENGVLKPLVVSRVEDIIRFSISTATSRNEIMELRKKLTNELDRVRGLVKEVESSELRLSSSYNTQVNTNLSSSTYISAEGATFDGYSQPTSHAHGDVDRRLLVRMNSELAGTGHLENRTKGLARVSSDVGAVRNLAQRPYKRQLTVAIMENDSMAGEYMEKEKRTPKANQYYRNSEFLLGKDRLPPESNKRLKTNSGRKHSRDSRFGFGHDKSMKQVFKNCSSLLQRLMKHKHGWVFNEPVNAKALGLVDYHDIIKHPMDLGTIKTRLSHNWYKSPSAFVEDVRLVFLNAMTYNPKGQDVHVMAEQLSEIFEERWAIIENEYNSRWKYPMYQEATLTTPTSRKAPPQSYLVPVSVTASAPDLTYASAPALTYTSAPAFAPIAPYAPRSHVGRTPVPKKPKAKDANKRDMTFDEKQRLSTNLESLPPEKLDAIIQIIRKRNASVSQNDDEIEVDIDRVDTETLWELDRFVTNYKKSLSKYKRKAELAMQARMVANQNNAAMQSTPAAATQAQVADGNAFQDGAEPRDDVGQRPGENGSRSSSSSSSSSDSGSSSSDSDSDSSSADGSDQGQSPRT